MTIEDDIAAASSENAELLNVLDATENAPRELERTLNNVKKVQEQVAEQQNLVSAQDEELAKYHKSHAKYNESVGRKWVYHIVWKKMVFEDKAKEAESAYLEAINKKHDTDRRCEALQKQLNEALELEASLKIDAEKHGHAHKRLDELYDQIFDGPTPGFPQEDDQEDIFKQMRQAFEDSKVQLKGLTSMIDLLMQASARIKKALFYTDAALEYLQTALFGLTGSHLDYLAESEANLKQVFGLVDRARRVTSNLGNESALKTFQQQKKVLEGLQRDRRGYIYEITIEDVGAWKRALSQLMTSLEGILKGAREKQKNYRSEGRTIAASLEEARASLRQIRHQAFEQVAGFGLAAPAYNECCSFNREAEITDAGSSNYVEPPVESGALHPESSVQAAGTLVQPQTDGSRDDARLPTYEEIQ